MARSVSRRRRDRSSSRSRSSSSGSDSSSSSSSSSSSVSSSSSYSSRSSSSSSSSSSSRSSRSSEASKSDRRRSPSPNSRVHVNKLTKNVNKNHLLEIFKSYGPIKNVDLPNDRYHPHLSRGTAFIEFEKVEDAEKAIKFMDGGQIDGQEIAVSRVHSNKAVPRQRSSRNGSWRKPSPRK